MSDGTHLLIPHASAEDAGCLQALRDVELPNLERLLARLQAGATETGTAETLSMPHERALARHHGIEAPDGCLPLAALQREIAGLDPQGNAWAWITPCHWRVGTDHIAMTHPEDLQLSPDESLQMLAAMRPFFEEDAIALEYESPVRWLARAEVFRGLPTASLDRVAGRTIDAWIPRTPQAGPLRRLQQEMQMLLYTHAANDERQAKGLAPVNSFWVSGAGALPPSRPPSAPSPLRMSDSLRPFALKADWLSWAAAWREIDVTDCARLSKELDAGHPVSLTLCGEKSARTWVAAASGGYFRGIGARLAGLVGRRQVAAALQGL